MDYGHAAERFMGMSESVWQRHANPWSGWSRVAVLPLLAMAVWSRVWIGWYAVILVLIVLAWNWLNPRVFPKPKSTDNWMSKVVLGERVWLNRKAVPIPDHHALVPHILIAISALGILPFVWGMWYLQVWPLMTGMIVAGLAKLWFCDRMVWLFEDMKERSDTYRSWLY